MGLFRKISLLIFILALSNVSRGNIIKSIDTLDESDIDELIKNEKGVEDFDSVAKELEKKEIEDNEENDLEELKEDVGDIVFEKEKKKTKNADKSISKESKKLSEIEKTAKGQSKRRSPVIFDVGEEERKLLEVSKYIQTKIPEKEWDDIAASSKKEKYIVQEGDYLWKIAKTLFGSGFYYSKIWSLNPYITNPHEIEPGMVLVFDTGDSDLLPTIQVDEFAGDKKGKKKKSLRFDLTEFGDDIDPKWPLERKKLIQQGVYFQYASENTYDDLFKIGKKSLNLEYEKYRPPHSEIVVEIPKKEYDETGFDKSSKVAFKFKEGYFLNTFITTNIVQDFGYIDSIQKEGIIIQVADKVYAKIDETVNVRPGDMFSIYKSEGVVEHPVTERSGHRYSIVAQVKAIRKINHLWECTVTEISGIMHRGDRVTLYTPKIPKILRTFSNRMIEAAIIHSYDDREANLAYGDVVYIDRGRADGVELGTVFEIFSFYDRGTGKRITPDPTYKIGEITVTTITDNFATGLITYSSSAIPLGSLAFTKTKQQAAIASRLKRKTDGKKLQNMTAKGLEELDVDLNLDDVSENLLKKVDKVKLTEEELDELDRQEREKSIIKEHEKDIRELNRLEKEIEQEENRLNQTKLDEDKFLEQQNLDQVENDKKKKDPNAFGALNEIEGEEGKKYMDEDLNAKENPYGLTKFDIEEIDELLKNKKVDGPKLNGAKEAENQKSGKN